VNSVSLLPYTPEYYLFVFTSLSMFRYMYKAKHIQIVYRAMPLWTEWLGGTVAGFVFGIQSVLSAVRTIRENRKIFRNYAEFCVRSVLIKCYKYE
jgi:hypothetical protein